MSTEAVTIRRALPADAPALRRLAVLDSAAVPQGDVLLAEVEGELRAAFGADGHAIADPFHHTAELVELLRLRAQPAKRPRLAVWRRLPPAPVPAH